MSPVLACYTKTLAALLLGHAVADRPLQPLSVSLAKNRRRPVPGRAWQSAMMQHAGTHGLMVAGITRSLSLGLLEAVVHAAIDDAKCHKRISILEDQYCHVGCKMLWAAWVTAHTHKTRP